MRPGRSWAARSRSCTSSACGPWPAEDRSIGRTLGMLYQRSMVLASEPPFDIPFVDNPLVVASFWQAKLTAIKLMARYAGLTVWPMKLSADYSYNEIPLAHGSPSDWAAWLLVGAAVAGILFIRQRNRTVCFLAGFAFLTLLPSSNILLPIGSVKAERFLYVPSIGVRACLVMVRGSLSERLVLQHQYFWAY